MYSNVSKRSKQQFGNTFARLPLLKPEKSSLVPSGDAKQFSQLSRSETRRIRDLSRDDSQSRGNFINARNVVRHSSES